MAKRDKEFGNWVSTIMTPHKLSIKQYEQGFIVKKIKQKTEERIPHRNTDVHDMTLLYKKKLEEINHGR